MLAGIMPINTAALPNVWSLWVEHIMKQKKRFDFQKASLVYSRSGATAAASTGFTLPCEDTKSISLAFSDNNNTDRVQLQGKSYIVKSLDDEHLIAFNGSRYLIVFRSKTMYILVLCSSRRKYEEGSKWLAELRRRLVLKDY